jgi:hypothetical protein
MAPEMRARFAQRYGIDVSGIILPAQREKSPAMRQVAERCMPTHVAAGDNMIVMPMMAHAAFAVMTDYLICVMANDKARLCEPSERKRLVEQLVTFKERRQNVLAFERAREALLATPMAQFAMKMGEMTNSRNGPVGRPFLGEEIDERITNAVAGLNREGYLTATDFSFMGLFLPAEYAPALAKNASGVARCG